MLSNRLTIIILVIVTLALQGCFFKSSPSVYPKNISQTKPIDLNLSDEQIYRRLKSSYTRWQGTPYGYGQQRPKVGADCSGFTQSVFKNQLAINLPRTTYQQIGVGKTVKLKHARPGDLVFFDLKNGYGHVGIYLKNNVIVQATSSKGVTQTNLNTSDWWADRVYLVKRVIR